MNTLVPLHWITKDQLTKNRVQWRHACTCSATITYKVLLGLLSIHGPRGSAAECCTRFTVADSPHKNALTPITLPSVNERRLTKPRGETLWIFECPNRQCKGCIVSVDTFSGRELCSTYIQIHHRVTRNSRESRGARSACQGKTSLAPFQWWIVLLLTYVRQISCRLRVHNFIS